MEEKQLKNILEASLLVAGRAMSVSQLQALFQEDDNLPDKKMIREALQALQGEYEGRGIELVEIASGYRLQSHDSVRHWVSKLFQERTPRYSRALLETLVLIAYRQPITRAEIEEVRGVAVSSNIIKTLQERSWVKVIGHKDVPGRPALLGTTKEFLDYFNLKRLDDLPTLTEIKDLDQFDALLAEEIGVVDGVGDAANDDATDENDEPLANDGNSEVTGDASAELEADTLLKNPQLQDVAIERDNAEQHKNDDNAAQAQSVGPEVLELPDAELPDAELPDADQMPQSDSQHESAPHDDSDPDASDPDASDLTQSEFSNAEHQLYKVIADFADEHQQEVDARDDLEQRQLSTGQSVNDAASAKGAPLSESEPEPEPENSAESELEALVVAPEEEALAQELAADLSQRLTTEELNPSDLPEPGDTLH